MKLKTEDARELARLFPGDTTKNWDPPLEGGPLEVVQNEQVDESRWMAIMYLVVRDTEGRYWGATWERGLTEYQDVLPFEDEGDEVTFTEVVPVEVRHIEYRKKVDA